MEYEAKELKTTVGCKLPEHSYLKCSFIEHVDDNKWRISVNKSGIASDRKGMTFNEDFIIIHGIHEIKVDLYCQVYDKAIKYYFGFHQPVRIQLPEFQDLTIYPTTTVYHEHQATSNTLILSTSNIVTTSNIDNAGMNGSYIVVVSLAILVVVALSLIYWNKKKLKAKKKLMGELEMSFIDGKQSVNNIYSTSNTVSFSGPCSTDTDFDFPDWLQNRKEMIYATSCIEKGKRLGDGNFGVVFEGKIRLGNAVYVFYHLVTSNLGFFKIILNSR